MALLTMGIQAATLPLKAAEIKLSPTEKLNLKLVDDLCFTKYANVLKAMMMVETYAGRYDDENQNLKFATSKRWKYMWYGIMQIEFRTAKWMVEQYDLYAHVNLSDEAILDKLMYSKGFNIYIANMYFKHLVQLFDGDIAFAILAYNVGPTNVMKFGLDYDPNNYLNKVNSYLKEM